MSTSAGACCSKHAVPRSFFNRRTDQSVCRFDPTHTYYSKLTIPHQFILTCSYCTTALLLAVMKLGQNHLLFLHFQMKGHKLVLFSMCLLHIISSKINKQETAKEPCWWLLQCHQFSEVFGEDLEDENLTGYAC